MISLVVNGSRRNVEVASDMPLLWVLRDILGLTGAKYACGIGACGACTVLVNGAPMRACVVPVSAIGDGVIVTIEGLSADGSHPVQRAWAELDVPQCGFCQSGQILAAVALLGDRPNPTDADIDSAMRGVLCRCGTYQRVRNAIKLAARIGRRRA